MPEWGGSVFVRAFDLATLLELAPTLASSTADATVALVVAGACDAGGVPLFRAEDASLLVGRRGTALQRVAVAVARVNGLDVDEGKADSAGR